MAKYVIDETTLQGLADAVRAEANTTDNLTTDDMIEEIHRIPSVTIDNLLCANSPITSIVYTGSFIRINNAFSGMPNLVSATLPNTQNLPQGTFNGCKKLEKVDLGENLYRAETLAFWGCESLVTLILRRTDYTVLIPSGALTGTPIERGEGYIYVPKALLSSCEADTNYADNILFRAIEDYPEICKREEYGSSGDSGGSSGSGTEGIEYLIDQSGVLDDTSGTVEEKVESLIDLARTFDWVQEYYINFKKDTQNVLFSNNATIVWIPAFDFSQVTNFYRMFFNCSSLLSLPPIDTSNGTNFAEMLRGCTSLAEIPPLNTSKGTTMQRMFNNFKGPAISWVIDTANVTDFSYMFSGASNIEEIKLTSTGNGTNFYTMFDYCSKLKTISTLDLSKSTDNTNIIRGTAKLENISFVAGSIKLSITIPSPVLSAESIQSTIDGLATVETAQTLTLHENVKSKLSEEQLATITSKNWSVA